MLCPECRVKVENGRCANDHEYHNEGGVLQLITPVFNAMLGDWLEVFNGYRTKNGARVQDPEFLRGLPYSGLKHDKDLWRLRVLDLELANKMIAGRKGLKILEIGAWNGWLTHHLAKEHEVLAVDHFTDEYDGLAAAKHFDENWTAVQLDLEHLDLIDQQFDIVIANRTMGYFCDLQRTLDQMKALLKPSGQLLLTGLNIFRDEKEIAASFKEKSERYLEQYEKPFFFKDIKGYLNADDEKLLRDSGIELKRYPKLPKGHLKSRLFPTAALYLYGTHG